MFEAFAVGALLPVGALAYSVIRSSDVALGIFIISLTIWHMAAILAILWRM